MRRAAAQPGTPRVPQTLGQAPEQAPEPTSAPASGFEAADAAARVAGRASPSSRTVVRPGRSHPADPRFQVAGPSQLTERAIAEYHYVFRDLRNIGVLVVVMVVLLLLATVVVKVSGIGQA